MMAPPKWLRAIAYACGTSSIVFDTLSGRYVLAILCALGMAADACARGESQRTHERSCVSSVPAFGVATLSRPAIDAAE